MSTAVMLRWPLSRPNSWITSAAWRRQRQIALDGLLRLTVRQRQKQDIARLQRGLAYELQLAALAQVGVLLMDVFAGVAFGGGLGDAHPRMKQQQPQQLAARVAGGP